MTGQTRPPAEPGAAPPGGPGAGADRGAPPASGLDAARAAAAIEREAGAPPPPGPLDGPRPRRPPRTRSELRPGGPTGFQTDEGVFVARTRRDGTVEFADRPNVRVEVPLPTPRNVARGVERWYDSLAPGQPRPGQPDPREPRAGDSAGTPPLAGGSFDLTDGIMGALGQDPYGSRKLAFLDRTRDERLAMAAARRSADLREALHRTRGELERLWRGPGSAAARRELLFLLWDECAETGSPEVVSTARAVRGAIVAFVRRRLPAGSAHAFTADELARHNARRSSTARFDPYAAPPAGAR
jgi:hypothetical protein